MIRLWGRKTSSNVMKVLWLLEELGLPYERIDVGGPFGGTETPEYRALQPLGLVPALEDDGFTLFESNAILRYLCNRHSPSTALYPVEPRARATVETWMDFQQTALNAPQTAVFLGYIRTPPAQRDPAALARAVADAARMLAVIEARLGRAAYVAGPDLSLADMAYGPHLHRWLNIPIEGRPDAPNLRAWYERLLARPAYATHCAIEIV
jgi:glutathione S-transferase